MLEIRIRATGESLTVNGQSWSNSPLTEELCRAIGSSELTDGASIIIDGKPSSKFRYFEKLGVAILESAPEAEVRRLVVYMDVQLRRQKRVSSINPFGAVGQRPTQTAFSGVLELNGKQLRSPLRILQFPAKGELLFVHRIAIGPRISAGMAASSGFVEYVSFSFKRD